MNLVNEPLPYAPKSKGEELISNNNGFDVARYTSFSMCFVTAIFAVFYIKERVSRAKLLQLVSGVNKVTFWLTAFVIDYVIFVLISLLVIGALAACTIKGFNTFDELARTFVILVVFGFAAIPLNYICSFAFQVPSTGLVRLSIGYIVTGVFAFESFVIFDTEGLKLRHVARTIEWIFSIFPHYLLPRGIFNLYMTALTVTDCTSVIDGIKRPGESAAVALHGERDVKQDGCDTNFFGFTEHGVGKQLVTLFIIGLVSFVILFAIEFRFLPNLYRKLKCLKR